MRDRRRRREARPMSRGEGAVPRRALASWAGAAASVHWWRWTSVALVRSQWDLLKPEFQLNLLEESNRSLKVVILATIVKDSLLPDHKIYLIIYLPCFIF